MKNASLTRRDFLRGIAGITASGILLPGDEIVRKFWRGWSSPTSDDHAKSLIGASMFSVGDLVVLVTNRDQASGSFAWWDGHRFIPYVSSLVKIRTIDNDIPTGTIPGVIHGVPIVDYSRYSL